MSTNTKCFKCHEHLTHLEDIFQCSICNNQIHYFCNGISEINFRKMSKNTKARITCTTCTTKPNSKPTIEPTTKLEDKIEDLIKSVSFMSQKFDTFETKLENIFKEIKSIKNDNEQIKIENARLTKDMNELKHKIEQIEQQNLGVSIEITGIPKTENENCLDIVKKIGEIIKTNVNVTEAKRITMEKSKTSIIIAKLESKENRSQLIRNSKLNRLNSNMLVKNWSVENKIYINEHLTKERRILFAKSRQVAREKNFKFVWINNADILIRKDENSRISRIRSINDLEKLIPF
ncbi:uncharacterized protein LOC132925655 [Rhopalosiphum padi]|uniref:uncharacterized protein LOC132925655 n=1 Tax=Rhopalosiphum padi TaxID=40932 RepID=UPI00298DD40E|nr:uncharacterized protein LOC132925655 [Rhopalosiphum padi]